MGLKEKQALAGLDFGWAERRIKEYTGTDIKFVADGASFSDDLEAIYMVVNQGSDYMANAIASLCNDAIGKEAFNGKGVTQIALINTKDGSAKVVFNGNVLELYGTWGESNRKYLSAGDIQRELENVL